MSKRVFMKYDKDGGNSIDVKELGNMMYDLGHPLTQSEIEGAAKILDTDGDGSISYEEFKAWWSNGEDRYALLKQVEDPEQPNAQYAEWMEKCIDHFKFFDADRNGHLDMEEFSKLYDNLKQHGYPLGTLADAQQALDKDGDSRVDLREYCQWLTDIKYGRVAAL